MDLNNIKEIKSKTENLNSRLQLLEELHKETLEKIMNNQQSCCHDVIFINKKYVNKAYDYLQYGKCLVCGKSITLTPLNIDLDNNKKVDEDNIIDIVLDNIEEWCIDCDCEQSRDQLKEAQRVFDSIVNNDYCLCFNEKVKYEIKLAIKNMKYAKKK